jgi:Cell Wall Hydrolase
MIPEHNFTPAAPLRPALPGDPPTDGATAPAANRRFVIGLAAVTLTATAAFAVTAKLRAEPMRITVPVRFAPYDPAQWAVFDAKSYEAALALDPSLPRPDSVGLAGATAAPAALELREEAYVGPAARPYVFKGATPLDASRAHYCLTAAVYYEAASETDNGMRGVAQTVLNRVRHPSFPNTVCGVVFQGSQRAGVCQFTFSCDGAMARAPSASGWARASRIASEALSGKVFASVGLATHYHTQAIWPRWGKSLVMTNIVGAHIFHRWRGRWGTPDAFRAVYAGREPVPGPYLPVAQQVAILGKGGVVATTLPTGPLAPLTPPVAAPGFSPAIVPVPQTADPAPTYADQRLSQSGQVREEYKKSGEWIK